MKTPRVNGKIPLRSPYWSDETGALLAGMRASGVPVRIIEKKGDLISNYERWWERLAMRLVRATVNRDVVTAFAQTFMDGGEVRVYLPTPVELDSYRLHRILRHEMVHVLQATTLLSKKPRLHWPGVLLFGFLYVFCLPFVFTVRARWERQAYLESLRVDLNAGLHDQLPALLTETERFFRSSQYAWMDPIRGGGFGVDGPIHASIRKGTLHARQSPLCLFRYYPFVPP